MTFVAPNLACGEARGGRIPPSGAVTDEQRRHRPNSAQPSGRQFFSGQTSLLAPHRSTSGYARRSRLVWPKNPLPRTSSYLCSWPLSALADRNFKVKFTNNLTLDFAAWYRAESSRASTIAQPGRWSEWEPADSLRNKFNVIVFMFMTT